MSKRAVDEIYSGDVVESVSRKHARPAEHVKKHTLDSDEEDSAEEEERYNILNENDIEGEEDGVAGIDGEVKLTPFNMKEELEEGHFDADGHYQWNKDKDIKDNWLDNIDWIKIKQNANKGQKEDDSDDDDGDNFDVITAYRRILELMQPGETIKRTLQRLGGKSAKMSSIERWKMRKAGIVDPNAELVTELTELSNKILTKMGNMDIYSETFEMIKRKYAAKTTIIVGDNVNIASTSATISAGDNDALDMYADDFDTKEKDKLTTPGTSTTIKIVETKEQAESTEVTWEFKWKPNDSEVHGPYSSGQMQQWTEEGYFKDGVLVRKCGAASAQFNSSNRIDFDLYI